MTHFTKLAAGLTGLAAIAAVSSPAAAQINTYGQVAPYGTPSNGGGIVGAIVDAVTGYGQYPQGNYGYEQTSQRGAVEMCARSAEQRLNSDRRYSGYGYGYGQGGYNNGYAQQGYAGANLRVTSITGVEHRSGGLRVSGTLGSAYAGQYANQYGQNGYQNGYQNGGMFRVVGITNVEQRMNSALRVRGIASSASSHSNSGWNQPRGDDQRYGDNNAYGGRNDRYHNAGMDYRFSCKINSRGAVTDLNLDRGTRSLRG